MIGSNLHTHTCRCKHASGTAADYARCAVEAGLKRLAFTEHSPFPGDVFKFHARPSYAEFPDYVAEVEAVRRDFPELKVLCGIECEYFPAFGHAYFQEMKEKYHLDLLVGSLHYLSVEGGWAHPDTPMTSAQLRWLADALAEIARSGIYTFMAHPDMMLLYTPWSPDATAFARDVLSVLKETGLPAEINAYGLRKKPMIEADGTCRPQYPRREFWDLAAEYGIRVVVNSDAHRPEDVYGNLDEAAAFARERGLRIVNEELP